MNYKELVEKRESDILQKAKLQNKLYKKDNQERFLIYELSYY